MAHNVTGDGCRVVGLTEIGRDGEIRFVLEIPGSEGGTHPQIAQFATGDLVVAWTESREGGVQQVRIARLRNAMLTGRLP